MSYVERPVDGEESAEKLNAKLMGTAEDVSGEQRGKVAKMGRKKRRIFLESYKYSPLTKHKNIAELNK